VVIGDLLVTASGGKGWEGLVSTNHCLLYEIAPVSEVNKN
jgi:hypothetical protein